jgi:hypothetical protein
MANKEETAVTVRHNPGALTFPDFITTVDVAPQNIGREDVRLPRIAVAQPLSPELDEVHEKYILGLKAGDLFNSVTGEVFGKGPVGVVVVRVEPTRYIEFNPIELGGGIKDRNIKANDPRTAFGPAGEKPIATKFREYIAFLSERLEPIGLSFKGASLSGARDLDTWIKMVFDAKRLPEYATVYALTSVKGPKAGFNYHVMKVQPAGAVNERQYAFASAYRESLATKDVVIDAEVVTADEEAPF